MSGAVGLSLLLPGALMVCRGATLPPP